jgi:beta-lactamase class A
MTRIRQNWLMLIVLLLCARLLAQTSVIELLERETIAQLRDLDAKTEGALGVAAIDLSTRRSLQYHGDTVFPQASSIKIPILMRMFGDIEAGKFRLSDSITLEPKDTVGGSGHLQHQLAKGRITLAVKDVITAMMETSDNTATNQCIRMVGLENVNRMLDSLGFTQTRLQRIMLDSGAAVADRENISTPIEMAAIVDLIYQGRAVSPDASKQMLDIMRLVKAQFRKALPAGTDIASKPGGLQGVKCESGVVFLKNRPFVLSVMTSFVPASSEVVEQAALLVYRHFERLSRANSYGHFVN